MGICLLMYPLFVHAHNPDRIQSHNRYIDFYRQTSDSEPEGYLYAYDSHSLWEFYHRGYKISCGYYDSNLRGQISALTDEGGILDFAAPVRYLSLELGRDIANHSFKARVELAKDPGAGITYETSFEGKSCQVSLETRKARAALDYAIAGDLGSIPFHWLKSNLTMRFVDQYKSTDIKASAYFPTLHDSLFANDLNMYGLHFEQLRRAGDNTQIKLQASYFYSSARLRYKGELYGKLDHLNLFKLGIDVGCKNQHLDWTLGINSYHSFIDDDSYFDIWPFSAWDAFLAHRSRIKRFHINSCSPFAGLLYHSASPDAEGPAFWGAISYHHHFMESDILLKNRKVVLYPFLFSYESIKFDVSEDLDAHLEIKPKFCYRYSGGEIELEITQLLPLKWRKILDYDGGEPSQGPGKKTKQWGGTQARLNLNFLF